MIWAILGWLLFGGSGGVYGASALMLTEEGNEELIGAISAIVSQDDRRQSAIQPLTELQADIRNFEKLFKNSGEKLNKLYQSHDSMSHEASAILDELNKSWEEGQARALDARFKLRDSLTEQEWDSLFGADAGDGSGAT